MAVEHAMLISIYHVFRSGPYTNGTARPTPSQRHRLVRQPFLLFAEGGYQNDVGGLYHDGAALKFPEQGRPPRRFSIFFNAGKSIGRALVLDPNLLILDEPTEGIQLNIVHEIGSIILDLKQQEDGADRPSSRAKTVLRTQLRVC